MKKLRILHLPKWYPNRTNDLLGLFTQRHVESTREFVEPLVIYGCPDKNLKGNCEIEERKINNVDTTLFYYPSEISGLASLDRLIKFYYYYRTLGKVVRKKIKEEKIDLIHVHVLLRSGLFALMTKWIHRVPYVITEHWTIYLKQNRANISALRATLSAFVAKKALNLNAVSKDLLQALNEVGVRNKNQEIIGNAVNLDVFKPSQAKLDNGKFNLITVIEFNEVNKNICGLLDAMKAVDDRFKLHIVGYGKDEDLIKEHYHKIGLNQDKVEFKGKMYAEDLAEFMAKNDLFVLFSRAENLPCVIIEAQACGLPVLSTDVGGIREMVDVNNGRLIPSEDKNAFIEYLHFFVENASQFNSKNISDQASARFSNAAVGEKMYKLYQKALS